MDQREQRATTSREAGRSRGVEPLGWARGVGRGAESGGRVDRVARERAAEAAIPPLIGREPQLGELRWWMGRPTAQRYLAAAMLVGAAVLVRFAIDPLTDGMYPFFTAYAAVVVSGWLLGIGPALLAAALGYLSHLFLFIEPRGAWLPLSKPHVVGSAMYAVTALLVCLLSKARTDAERRYLRGLHESRIALNTLRALLDSVPEGVVVMDMPGGKVRLVSRAGEEMAGEQAGKIAGLTVYELAERWKALDPETGQPIPHAERPFVRMLEHGEPVVDRELLLERPDGTGRLPVLLNGAAILDRTRRGPDGRPLIVGGVMLYRDITARKRAQAAIAESAAKYQLLFQQGPKPKWLVDMRTLRLLECNDAAVESYGYTREEFLARTLSDLRVPEEPATEVELRHDEVNHFQGTVATRHRTKSGRVLDIELTARELPVHHEGGGDAGVLLVEAFDVTDLKQAQADLERKALELERSNADLEQFAHAAAHDLKEPLRGLLLYASFLLEDYGDALPDEGKRMVNTISRLSARGVALVDSLLDVSQAGRAQLKLTEVDLNRLLSDVLEGLASLVEEQHVEITRTGTLPTVRCDRVQIGRVFTNLITNAVKYNRNSPKRVEIGAAVVGGAAGPQTPNVPLRAVGRTAIYVRDNGIGIKQEHQAQIFKMFRRLHTPEEYGGGTGAGLALVQKLVRKHGGEIWVESELGKGSTFWFTLTP